MVSNLLKKRGIRRVSPCLGMPPKVEAPPLCRGIEIVGFIGRNSGGASELLDKFAAWSRATMRVDFNDLSKGAVATPHSRMETIACSVSSEFGAANRYSSHHFQEFFLCMTAVPELLPICS